MFIYRVLHGYPSFWNTIENISFISFLCKHWIVVHINERMSTQLCFMNVYMLLANIMMIVGWIRLFSWPCSSSLTCFTIMLMSFCGNKLTVYCWIVAFSIAVKPKIPVNKERLIFPTYCHTFFLSFLFSSQTETSYTQSQNFDALMSQCLHRQKNWEATTKSNKKTKIDISETSEKENNKMSVK